MFRKLTGKCTYGMSVGLLLMLAGAAAQEYWIVFDVLLACALAISIVKAYFVIKSS